jgi:hypothetical protein
MIIAVVTFDLPPASGRADALALYRHSAPAWAGNPDLVEKTYLFDPDRGVGGGVYRWRSRAAAQRWLGVDYRRMIRERYGAEPRIALFEAVLHVDTATRAIVET